MTEIWKDIIGFEGLYQVSNMGNVRSLPRNTTSGKVLKPGKSKDGYLQVVLYKDGKRKSFRVHRLVYEAFNGPIPEGMQANHINECKEDSRLSNINLMTPKENCNWGTRNERSAKTKSKPVLQYTKEGSFIREWPSAKEIQRQLGYSNCNISKCCDGKLKTAYKHIWKWPS